VLRCLSETASELEEVSEEVSEVAAEEAAEEAGEQAGEEAAGRLKFDGTSVLASICFRFSVEFATFTLSTSASDCMNFLDSFPNTWQKTADITQLNAIITKERIEVTTETQII
jgi:hypothetical protein